MAATVDRPDVLKAQGDFVNFVCEKAGEIQESKRLEVG